MAVENTTTTVEATGNSSATVFSFSPIVLFEPRSVDGGTHDLEVTLVTIATGAETVLAEGSTSSTYSVSVTSYPGTGSITYPASGGSPIANTHKLIIKRKLRLKQYEALNNQGGYYADTQEEMHDRHRMVDLQQQEEIDRAVKVPIGSSDTPEQYYQAILDAVDDADTAAAAAAASQSAAATSATNAATSATNAATSATNAATSATAAQTAETNAETAETNAETAETNAEAAQAAAESAAAAVGASFTFDATTTMADPGAGDFRFNNATVASVTAIAFDDTSADAGNPDVSAFIGTWAGSTNTVKGHLVLKKKGAPATFAVFAITGLTDNSGWTEIAVTHVASNGTWSAADVAYVQFTRAGDVGATGSIGAGGNLGGALFEIEGAAVASASTCDIWTTDGNTRHVTGTTTITSFGTAPQAGARMKLIFDDAVLLTNSANLALPGGANYTTAAGDWAEVYADTTTQFDVRIFKQDGTPVGRLALAGLPRGATSGHVLTAQGSGADPVYAAVSSGALTLLSTTDIGSSAVASVTVTGISLTTYQAIVIEFIGMEPTSDNSQLYMRIGDSGGISSSSVYHSAARGYQSGGTSGDVASSGVAQWVLTNAGVRSSTYGGVAGRIELRGKRDTSMPVTFTGMLAYWKQPDNVSQQYSVGGSLNASGIDAANIDRFQFLYNSGNLRYGRIKVYGLT